MSTFDEVELSQRLGLYQVFLKLYEHHRGLLDEILELETSGSKAFAGVGSPFIQGVMRSPQAYLVTNLLDGKTQALTQPQQVWTIGRDTAQVGLAVQDKRLSRCHAAIRYIDSQGFYLVDLQSSNGSFVNGERVHQPHRLQDGDRLRLGSLAISFFLCKTALEVGCLSDQMQSWIERAGTIAPTSEPKPTPSTFVSGKDNANIYPPDKTLLLPRSNLWEGKPASPPEA